MEKESWLNNCNRIINAIDVTKIAVKNDWLKVLSVHDDICERIEALDDSKLLIWEKIKNNISISESWILFKTLGLNFSLYDDRYWDSLSSCQNRGIKIPSMNDYLDVIDFLWLWKDKIRFFLENVLKMTYPLYMTSSLDINGNVVLLNLIDCGLSLHKNPSVNEILFFRRLIKNPKI